MRFTLNGQAVSFEGSGARRLLDVLREELRATGTKEGCGEGECGACSVLIDGEVVDSCLVAVGQVEGLHARTLRPEPEAVLDLWSLNELKGVRRTSEMLEIAAAEPYTGIIRSPDVQQHLPALAAAARTIGAAQIQNRGTLGGNLANASPAGDTLPVLLAYDATVVTDPRAIPIDRVFTGYRQTPPQADELITRGRLPLA